MLGPARRLWSAGPVFVIAVPTPRPSMRCLLVAAVRTPRAADHLCTVAEAQAETGATRLRRSLCRRFHSTRLRIHRPSQPAGFSGNRFSNAANSRSRASRRLAIARASRNAGCSELRAPASLPEWRQRVASRQSPRSHRTRNSQPGQINAQAALPWRLSIMG
jgi:hypothetical protein